MGCGLRRVGFGDGLLGGCMQRADAQKKDRKNRQEAGKQVPRPRALRDTGLNSNVNAHGNRLPNPASHFGVSINVRIKLASFDAASSYHPTVLDYQWPSDARNSVLLGRKG
jgi:hypothetical protein